MVYIFCISITPNAAPTNRLLSILKAFDELGKEATLVVLTTNTGYGVYRVPEEYHHVKVKYLWKDWSICRRVFNRLHAPYALKKFLSLLKEGDCVFCYGSSEYLYHFIGKKDVTVFHERTESPEVLPLSSPKAQAGYFEACRQLDGLFVISTALKRYFVDKGVEEGKVQIVNMTVDSNRFIGLQKNPKAEDYIAYCGTASNNKDGVDELIKAFAIVTKTHFDIKLYIIGKTPSSDDKSGNLKLIDSLGLNNKVVLTGMIEASKMPQMLKDAKVLALDRPDSLQARNGFPTKLGEYLLTENPVVVTKVGDIPKFLKDGESALLAEQRNPDEFASKLCWALEHPKEAAEIGKRGKEVAMKEFNYLIESKKIIDTIYG